MTTLAKTIKTHLHDGNRTGIDLLAISHAVENDSPNVFDAQGTSRSASVKQYWDDAKFLMPFIGINVFSDANRTGERIRESATQRIEPTASFIRPAAGERLTKRAALRFVRDHGIHVGTNTAFATLDKTHVSILGKPQRWVPYQRLAHHP